MMCGSYEILDGIPRRAVPMHVLVGHGNGRANKVGSGTRPCQAKQNR